MRGYIWQAAGFTSGLLVRMVSNGLFYLKFR